MAHPGDTKYHIIRTTSSVDGTTLETLAESHPDRRLDGVKSQDGLAACLDSRAGYQFSDYYAIEPKLAEYVFTAGDLPSYLSLGCENLTWAEARVITNTGGASGSAWAPASEV